MLVDLVEESASNLKSQREYSQKKIKWNIPFINCENSSGHVLGMGREYLLVAIPKATCIWSKPLYGSSPVKHSQRRTPKLKLIPIGYR